VARFEAQALRPLQDELLETMQQHPDILINVVHGLASLCLHGLTAGLKPPAALPSEAFRFLSD
jgi:hypothetical protein